METRRQRQVGELVKRTFSMVLQQEGAYVYGTEALVSVTHVVMSPDMGLAKVYVSVYNVDQKQMIVNLINNQMPRLKQLLSHRIRKQVRRIPNLDVYIDETLDEIDRVNDLFDKVERGEHDDPTEAL